MLQVKIRNTEVEAATETALPVAGLESRGGLPWRLQSEGAWEWETVLWKNEA